MISALAVLFAATVLTNEVKSAHITCQSSDFDRQEGVVLFEGDVVVRYSDGYEMSSDRMYMFLSKSNELSRVVALGNVAISNALRAGSCAMAIYRRKKGEIEMFGDGTNAFARLEDRGERASELEGTKIRFWLNSEQVEVENSRIGIRRSEGGRLL